jgi:diphthamide synthase (EF-2-diphthine--ammonia ligase)
MKDGENDPLPKDREIEVLLELSSSIEDRMLAGLVFGKVSFKHQSEETEPGCEEHVVKGRKPVNEVNLTGKAVPIGEMKFSEDENHILVEVVANHLRDADVA